MKVAILGEKKIVLAFKSLGVSVFGVDKEKDFNLAVTEIENSNYSILFVTENIVEKYKNKIEQFYKESLPAILIIPGTNNNQGIGKESLKKTIERALGADIGL
ncbi:V-type ATP synthase subunit F [Patescibacteria group bacterium]|nr:V-type ATP synthase subunit F [Patescibacteria group bacterium]